VQEGPIQGTRPDLFGDSDSEEEAEIPAEEVTIVLVRIETIVYQSLTVIPNGTTDFPKFQQSLSLAEQT
jgi:hypothetical protein